MLCTKCGEPWYLDSLHDSIKDDAYPQDLKEVLRKGDRFDQDTYERDYWKPKLADFRNRGCAAITGTPCKPETTTTAMALQSALEDLLGDDVDGIENSLEDLGSW